MKLLHRKLVFFLILLIF